MTRDERLSNSSNPLAGQSTLPAVEGFSALQNLLKEGQKLYDDQQVAQAADEAKLTPQERRNKLKKKLRQALEEFVPKEDAKSESSPQSDGADKDARKSIRDADAAVHNQLLQSLRSVVYDSDLKIPGKTTAINREVDEALTALIKGGSFDDRKLAQVVEELFSLEGRASNGALMGKFAAQEVPPADLPSDDSPACDTSTADATLVGIGTARDNDTKAAQEIADKLKKAHEKEVQSESQIAL